MRYKTPNMPYVESFYQGGKQRPQVIILSPSFTTSQRGAALGIAQAWHSSSSKLSSGHYAVDEETRFRCTPDKIIAGHESTQMKGVIHITICAEPFAKTFFWNMETHGKVLRNAASLVAELSLVYKIRTRYLDEFGLLDWQKRRSRRRGGVFVDDGVSNWPFNEFMSEVRALRALKTHI